MEYLSEIFENLEAADSSILLNNQLPWADMFQKGIFQNELKSGNIIPYPTINPDDITEVDSNTLWNPFNFKQVIFEWKTKIPIFQFNCIGGYLLFYKMIYIGKAKQAEHAINNLPIEQLKNIYISESADTSWLKIEIFLYNQAKMKMAQNNS